MFFCLQQKMFLISFHKTKSTCECVVAMLRHALQAEARSLLGQGNASGVGT